MKFIRLVIASPFIVVGFICMTLFILIAGKQNSTQIVDAMFSNHQV